VEGTSILILSDEVYENIVFDGKQHLSICKYPELKNRSLLVASFGKTVSCYRLENRLLCGSEISD
jgi:methionine aminotransferase